MSAKLTQNTPFVFVVNSMVITTYLTWRADTANSVFGQFKTIIQECLGGIWQVIELGQDIMSTNIFTNVDKDQMKTLPLRERKP